MEKRKLNIIPPIVVKFPFAEQRLMAKATLMMINYLLHSAKNVHTSGEHLNFANSKK